MGFGDFHRKEPKAYSDRDVLDYLRQAERRRVAGAVRNTRVESAREITARNAPGSSTTRVLHTVRAIVLANATAHVFCFRWLGAINLAQNKILKSVLWNYSKPLQKQLRAVRITVTRETPRTPLNDTVPRDPRPESHVVGMPEPSVAMGNQTVRSPPPLNAIIL